MYREAILEFSPSCPQEESDKEIILRYIDAFPDTVLTRENKIAHITSSGFIVNKARDKVLMVHHNIYGTWVWTGGHADGNPDLLEVALREAEEETGVTGVRPLTGRIDTLDILPVFGHIKRGVYISAHLHLSVGYLLEADENAPVKSRPDENSAVKWLPLDKLSDYCDLPCDNDVYSKLIAKL